MFREMRRKNQLLPLAEAEEILKNNTVGILALSGDNGYPYSVPMSYAYDNGRIIFHSAKNGHKTDAIEGCDKASFCVVDKNDIVAQEYTTYYRSVIVFGRIHIVREKAEMTSALHLLGEKYNPGHHNECREEIEKFINNVVVLILEAEHITGKAAKELLR